MADRSITQPPIPTPEYNLIRIDALNKEIQEFRAGQRQILETLNGLRELLIELAGRTGKDGMIGMLRERLEASAASQGRRIGELEAVAKQQSKEIGDLKAKLDPEQLKEDRQDIRKLRETRAVLIALSTIGLVAVGTALKVFFGT